MRNLWFFDFTYWLTWVSLAIGIGVGWMVFIASGYLGRRRRLAAVPDEEDLPWDDLLEMLKARQDGEGGSLPEGWDDLSSEELLQLLLVKVPETPTGDKAPAAPENASALPAGRERRNSRRRWSNPTEVRITAPFHEKPLHGLVINRSTGGLAFLADAEFPAGTVLFVRALEAPASVPGADVVVRHSRSVGKLWLAGCQYRKDIPWSVKVWFG